MLEKIINSIIHADCMDVLRSLPDKCVDLVLTDPPYFRVVANDWDRQWKDISEFQKWVGEIGAELQRVMKGNASLYWFGDDKTIAYCQIELDKKFHLINSLIWEKPAPIACKGIMQYRSFATSTERLLFYEKKGADGNRETGNERIHSMPESFQSIKAYMRRERAQLMEAKGFKTKKEVSDFLTEILGHTAHSHYFSDSQFCIPNKENYKKLRATGFFHRDYEDLRRDYEDLRRDYEDLLRVWNPHPDALEVLEYCTVPGDIHPTQKPIPLISFLMERSSKEGALVLDPFSGSGTTAIAAHRLGRRFVCIEKDADYHAASVARLTEEKKQQRLDFSAAIPPASQLNLFDGKGN
jgi:site-specific DNA-methyltransferase (adenine-specific)